MSAAEMETDSLDMSRTVVVSGVPAVLPVSRMIDKLTIHFQSYRRSHGGDVEVVKYPTNMDGVAFVTFEQAKDAARVVRKEQHIMKDNEFPDDYPLTVFPFTRDVFLYVPSASVNLSVFGRDQATLIQSLRSAHRSLRFQPFPQQMKATIEGPFTAVQALREDLIRRASRLKSEVSAQTAAVKLRETPLNPRVISHHGSVGSVSRSGSKAKLGPASSDCLSTALQTTGEATEVQSRLSNAKTENASSRQKVSHESVAAGNLCDTNSDEEEEPRDMPRLDISTEYRTEQAKASSRQVLNAGVRSSLSGRDLLLPQEISAKQLGVDDISEKRRPDRISATKIRRENHMGSSYNSTDYLKESDQISSAVTAKIHQTRHKDVSTSSKNNTEDTEELSVICPEDQEQTCVWVDSYIFRYIKKYDKEFDRCLRGLDASVKCEGTDLTRIVLTERQTSMTASQIQQALQDLKILVRPWQLRLRVHQIDCDEEEMKKKLIQICDDLSFLYFDVLYLLEDSCIKFIGPSVFSYLFCKRVKDEFAKLKDTPRM
ncbi:hypothetical protein ABVT39_026759 [Epinephelus coioides]